MFSLTPEEIKAKEELRAKKARRKDVLVKAIKYLRFNGMSVRKFLENDPFPKVPYELRDSDKFFKAIKFQNKEWVEEAIRKSEKYLDQIDYFGQTPFHWAAKLGYDNYLEFFLKHSKRFNIRDKQGRTPLFLAALGNQKKCVELLIEKGANAQMADFKGRKPEDVTTNYEIKKACMIAGDKNFLSEFHNKANDK